MTRCACGQQLAEVRVEDGGLVGHEPDEPRGQTHDDFDDGDSLMRPSFYDRGLA